MQAKIYAEFLYHYMQRQNPALSATVKNFPHELRESLDAARMLDEYTYVVGGEQDDGAVVVSLTGELPDFFPTHKVVVVVPFEGDPMQIVERIHPSTQTVAIYPESLKDRLARSTGRTRRMPLHFHRPYR